MNQLIICACLIFGLFALLLPINPAAMFADPDVYWHIAAGDLIRELGHVPHHDSWSFASEGESWLNISWLWDIGASLAHQSLGWYGVIALNSISLAAICGVVFAACFIRTRHGIASFIVILLLMLGILSPLARPFQITYLFLVIIMLVLSQITRGRISARWLVLMPIFTLAWVNMHGGFLALFMLLGIYILGAVQERKYHFAATLALTASASLLVALANPFGIDIFAATMRTLESVARIVITEWKPFAFSMGNTIPIIYIVLFIWGLMHSKDVTRSEKHYTVFWLLLGLSSQRHMPIFALLAAPIVADALRQFLLPKTAPKPLAPRLVHIAEKFTQLSQSRAMARSALAMCALLCLLLFTPWARAAYTPEKSPLMDLSDEIAFIEKNYPDTHLLTHYNLGGQLIYYTRGKVPVWVDGRTETAYPKSTMEDYMRFLQAKEGWEDIFTRYNMGGALIINDDFVLMDRLKTRKGWNIVYEGKTATLLIQDAALKKPRGAKK